ncbi:MAG: vWA domain-containing protein [Pirellulaceae bacterium]
MRDDLTDITVVLDRSGSMESCRQEAENGLNHFIEEQAKRPGEALFSLMQFDTEYEMVHRGIPIGKVPKCAVVPRGMTALLDAVGRAIRETGLRLHNMPEDERPGLVLFVIITDGLENSSHEFNCDQIKQMIEHQKLVYSWQFTFLGANQDAFAEAGKMGIDPDDAACYSASAPDVAFSAAAGKLGRMRDMQRRGEKIASAFTLEERDAMKPKSSK